MSISGMRVYTPPCGLDSAILEMDGSLLAECIYVRPIINIHDGVDDALLIRHLSMAC